VTYYMVTTINDGEEQVVGKQYHTNASDAVNASDVDKDEHDDVYAYPIQPGVYGGYQVFHVNGDGACRRTKSHREHP